MHAFTVMLYALYPKKHEGNFSWVFACLVGRFRHFSSLNYLWLTLMGVAAEKIFCMPNRSLKALVRKSIKTPSV
jgi:hypothetical protein